MAKADRPPALMIQGTGSDVGKSVLVAGLCRAYARRGLAVRPFKPQNMSNNAAVVDDGAEIGRAQALQARAAGIAPAVDMNPVLLKPEGERRAQVVVQGRRAGSASARDYQALKRDLLAPVLDSFARLGQGAELVLVEGAGSPAEVNLRARDIANMGFAQAADLPVVLVADIDRGGVIASLVGTHGVLHFEDRRRLRGYIVNKFRGDASLFDDGIAAIGRHTGLDCLGIVPWSRHAGALPAEDSMALELPAVAPSSGPIVIAVPRLPRIANHDDLDPLRAEPDVDVRVLPLDQALPGDVDLVLLPGSKATIADLVALRESGWDIDIAAHRRRGGRVLGLCGGYQMLGRLVRDPTGIEGPAAEIAGLGLLDVETEIGPSKRLGAVAGRELASGLAVVGYEMHMGSTVGPDTARPLFRLAGRDDGALSADGRVMGSYLHGLFQADAFRAAFLARLAPRARRIADFQARVEAALDGLAAELEAALDLDRLLEIASG